MYEYYERKYYKKKADYNKIERMYESNKYLRNRTNNTTQKFFEENKRICKEKYERVLTNVLNLKNKLYNMDNRIINGVDLSNLPKVKLDEEKFEAREIFINQLLYTYETLEDNEDFSNRKKGEYANFAMVMNAINTQRCAKGFVMLFNKEKDEPYSEKQIKIMMRMIKAADTLTIKGGQNILQEFLNTPFINNTLSEIRKDPTFKKMKLRALDTPYPKLKETENSRAKRIANEKMSKLTEEKAQVYFNMYKRRTSSPRAAHKKAEDEWKDAIYRISALQQGFRVSPISETGYINIQNKESALINTNDIRNLGRNNIVTKVLVNGVEYETIKDNSMKFNER